MADFFATLCTFAILAAVIAIAVFLVRRQKRLAGLSAVCTIALAVNFVVLADMDARSRGFADLHDMQAALNAEISNPAVWMKKRDAIAASDAARLAAQKAAEEDAWRSKFGQ
jgi:hypothetical protein